MNHSLFFFWFKLRITRRCQGVGGPLGDVHRDDAKILPTCDGIHLLEEQRRPQGHSQRSQYYVLGDAFRIVVDDTTMRPISANELFVFSLPSLSSFSVFHDGLGGDHLRVAEERLGQQLVGQLAVQSQSEVESSWKGNQLRHLSMLLSSHNGRTSRAEPPYSRGSSTTSGPAATLYL